MVDTRNSQVLLPSVLKAACCTVTVEAPEVTLKFMVRLPVFRMRADWLPFFLSVDKLPIRASLKYHEPEVNVTLAAAYAVLEPDSKFSERVVNSVIARIGPAGTVRPSGSVFFLQAVNSMEMESTPTRSRSWDFFGCDI